MTYVLNDVAVVGNKEEGAGFGHVDLHADETCEEVVISSGMCCKFGSLKYASLSHNKYGAWRANAQQRGAWDMRLTIGMSRQMVQGNALAKVEGLVIKSLPVEAELEIVLQVDTLVRTSSHTPERTLQLTVMHPDLNIWPVHELIQTSRVIEMQVSNNNLLNIFNLIACCFDLGTQLVMRFVSDTCEDVGELGAPDFGIVFPAASLPEDEAFVRVFDQNAVAGQLATLVDEGLILLGHGGGIASSDDEGFVTLEPSDFENVELGALGTNVGDMAWHGTAVELGLNSGHVCRLLYFGSGGLIEGLFEVPAIG